MAPLLRDKLKINNQLQKEGNQMQQEFFLDPRIKAAERLRERGKTQAALDALIVLADEFLDARAWLCLAATIGQIIVCYKHFAQNRLAERRAWIDKMSGAVAWGKALNIPESEKRTFVLREGDVAAMRGNTQEALRCYREAVRLAEHTSDENEYRGHLAEAMAESGELYAAAIMIRDAVGGVCRTRYAGMEHWRRLVILSGLFARQVKVEQMCGRKVSAGVAFFKGYTLAWWLLVRHWSPQRWRQYHQAIRDELLKFVRRR